MAEQVGDETRDVPPPIEGGGAALAVVGLTKSFGPIRALRDVSLSVSSGEIRAVCGENGAGKSTLVKILTGVYRPDSGRVSMGGTVHDIRRPQQAQDLGIAFVSQELSLAPHLSVADNIWLGSSRVPVFHRRADLRNRARAALDTLGLDYLNLDTPVGALSMGERQLVEIARMLSRDAQVLILDEPTATLSDVEIERIFFALKALRDEGRTIIYITHRLGEVFELCDSVTVLRNGSLVDTSDVGAIDRDILIEKMLGRSVLDMYPAASGAGGDPVLTVENLRLPDVFEDVGFVVQRGRIVSIAGQIGSGATEVVRVLAGMPYEVTGRVTVAGERMRLGSVAAAQARNVNFVSEDRAGEGIFLHLRVLDNLVATRLAEFRRFGVLDWRAIRRTARNLAVRVGMDESRLGSAADELSGGNQQKIAFGRAADPERPGILLMNEPTRGVDVGARAEIYGIMRSLCESGYGLVMTSSDLEEVVGLSDVVITMFRGKIVGRYDREEIAIHRILADITHPVDVSGAAA